MKIKNPDLCLVDVHCNFLPEIEGINNIALDYNKI